MKYLAISFDDEHSYMFDEVDLYKVQEAMRTKMPFKFADGTVVAGGDIKRIEPEGGGSEIGVPLLPYHGCGHCNRGWATFTDDQGRGRAYPCATCNAAQVPLVDDLVTTMEGMSWNHAWR